MFASGIGGRSLDWANRSLAGDATFELALHFFRAPLLHRISAAAQHPCDQEQDRHAYHLLILESRRFIARALDR